MSDEPNDAAGQPDELPELLPWEPAKEPRPPLLERLYQTAKQLRILKNRRELLALRRRTYVKIWRQLREQKGLPWPPEGWDEQGRRIEPGTSH